MGIAIDKGLEWLDSLRRHVPQVRRWLIERQARRPTRPTLDRFRRWVAAKTRLHIDRLIETRVRQYDEDIQAYSGGNHEQRVLSLMPLTRGDFIAHVFAAFTDVLHGKDEYVAFSTFEFWDTMDLAAGRYNDANLAAAHRVNVSRVMLVRPSKRIDAILKSPHDPSAIRIRERLHAHELHVGSRGDGSYRFSYAFIKEQAKYFAARTAYHTGVFKFVFAEGITFYVTMTPRYLGESGTSIGRTRLERLDIQVHDNESDIRDVLEAVKAVSSVTAAGGPVSLPFGAGSISATVFSRHADLP